MRIGRKTVALAIVNMLAFVATWVPHALHAQPGQTLDFLLHMIYLISMFLGAGLTVFGFIALTKGRPQQLRAAVLCILFAMVPGCAGLITLLSQLGTHPA
jgi:hypothetical protein